MTTSATFRLRRQSPATRYALAALAAVFALVLRGMLSPLLGPNNPYHTVWAAVVFSAWYCGVGPAIITTLIGSMGVWYWFLEPLRFLHVLDAKAEISGLIAFWALSGLIIALGEANRRSQLKHSIAEQEFREKESEFHLLADSIPELCWMAHGDGHIFWYNERWYEYTGATPEQMDGWGWQSVHDPEMLPSVLERWRASLQNGQPFEMEFPLRGADGVFRWFLTRVRPLRDSDGKIVRWFGTNTNIHQQRQMQESLTEASQKLDLRIKERTAELNFANQNLRQLTGRLLQLRDDEQRRLARELHDSVGQLLVALAINTSKVHGEVDKLSPEAGRAVAENAVMVDQISSEIRTIAHLLHPPLLDEVGLSSAVTWYVDGFSERSKIQVALELSSDLGRLPYEMETSIFRTIQECLTNIHRHSGSKTATVRLVRSDGELRLEVGDSGSGLPVEKQINSLSSNKTGVGIRGMRERIGQLGGNLEIHSNGAGTVVTAILPVGHATTGTASDDEAPLN